MTARRSGETGTAQHSTAQHSEKTATSHHRPGRKPGAVSLDVTCSYWSTALPGYGPSV
jgi:hypothetical protein